MFTGQFWKATAERAIKTAAQALIAFLTVDYVPGTDLDFGDAGLGVLVATLLSVLSSIVSAGAGGTGPSLGPERLARDTTPGL